MRAIILATTAALVMSVQLAATARAQDDTTVIRRDQPEDSTTIIKKRDDVNMFPIPHTEEHKTIIHKDHRDDDME